MTHGARKIFIATALGTMLGLYASIAFLPDLVWWFGALAGGISAGFIYGLPDIVRCSPAAFRVAKNDLQKTGRIFPALFETTRKIWKMIDSEKWTCLLFAEFVVLLCVWFSSVLLFDLREANFIARIIFIAGIIYLLPAAIILQWGTYTSGVYDPNNELNKKEEIKRAKKAIFFITPPGLFFLLTLVLIKLIFITIEFGPLAAYLVFITLEGLTHFLITFVKTLFFLVHSRELVLCAIDAGLAVLISYPLFVTAGNSQTGPALLFGGLIGGLIGILHYEIISVRILRVSR